MTGTSKSILLRAFLSPLYHLSTKPWPAKSFLVGPQPVKSWAQFYIPYARHYNPRFVYFLPHFYIEVRFILQTTLWTKNGNFSFFKPKIRGLYSRAVSDRERAIMARVRYTIQPLSEKFIQEVPTFRDFWYQKGIMKFGDHKF